MEKIYTFDPQKKRIVFAGIFYNRNFFKKVDQRHFMRMVQGYGIQEDVIERLLKRGCEKVILKTPLCLLVSNFSDWLEEDIDSIDYGSGKQVFLPVKRMKRIKLGRNKIKT